MSVFVSKKVDMTSDATFTLYTVPSATTAIIKSILISNDDAEGQQHTINITITNSSNAVFSIAFGKLIEGAQGQSGEPVEVLTNPLIAETGDIIKVAASSANKLHAILSAMEVTPRNVVT
jgi:hypothetical protein